MDPITALQVASSIISFVDFSRTLVSDAVRLYKSPAGRSKRTVELATVADHLGEMRSRIQEGLSQYRPTSTDDVILKLCQKCVQVGAMLQHTIDSLTARGTTKLNFAKSSFVVAARGLWKRGQIVAMNQELDQIRSQMMMALMVSLWRDNKVKNQPEEQIDQNLQDLAAHLGRTVQPVAKEVANLRRHDAVMSSSASDVENRGLLVKDVWESDWQPETEVMRLLRPRRPGGLDSNIEDAILESLSFPDMDDRGTMVQAAYEQTFKWIFRANSAVENPDDDPKIFADWLESEKKTIYWITGKPGSGKSTLMKYIMQQPELGRHLAKWAGPLAPLWTSYYFWDAGSNPLQKSRPGMLRTLLYHCLQKRRDLLPVVLPRRCALYSILGNTYFTPPAWTWEELSDAFSTLASMSGKDFRLAMFLDGLDEFDGNCADLIAFIKELNSQYDIKICVASRPWTDFADALVQSPSLMMQELTQKDILNYVRGHFESSSAFHERKAISHMATDQLVQDVARKAEGVFLWVSIVVSIMIRRLRDGQSMAELQTTLEALPNDMSDLYTSIWSRIEPAKIQAASRFFQVKIASMDIVRLDVKLLWATDGERLPTGNDAQIVDTLKPILKRRLDTHTRGILEISPSGTVDFLHRSAKDWLMGPAIWEKICSKTPPDYDPCLALIQAANSEILPSLWPSTDLTCWGQIIQFLTLAANVVETPETTPQLIDCLDRMNNILAHEESDPAKYSAEHWSTSKFRNDIRSRYKKAKIENSFVGLTAQFAILPYVRAKVEQNPRLLWTKMRHLQISLLENVIYGWEGDATSAHDTDIYVRAFPVESDKVPAEYNRERWFLSDKRIGMIKFLLLAGESPKRQAHMHELNYITVSQRVAAWGNQTEANKSNTRLRYGNRQYWDGVAGVFVDANFKSMERWKKKAWCLVHLT